MSFSKYNIIKIKRKIKREGSREQKKALEICEELDLFSKDCFLEGNVLFDFCSQGFLFVNLFYPSSLYDNNLLLEFINKFSSYPKYKLIDYKNKIEIEFFYKAWKVILTLTNQNEKEIKNNLFIQEYLLENLNQVDREKLLELYLKNLNISETLYIITNKKFGYDHVLSRELSIRQLNTDIPYREYTFISGLCSGQDYNYFGIIKK